MIEPANRAPVEIDAVAAKRTAGPGVDGQAGAIEPADDLVAGDQVAFVAKRVCGFLDLAIVRPRGLRVGGDSSQTRESFDESPFEHAPLAAQHRREEHVEPDILTRTNRKHLLAPARVQESGRRRDSTTHGPY